MMWRNGGAKITPLLGHVKIRLCYIIGIYELSFIFARLIFYDSRGASLIYNPAPEVLHERYFLQ
jgi:hypothetical protein